MSQTSGVSSKGRGLPNGCVYIKTNIHAAMMSEGKKKIHDYVPLHAVRIQRNDKAYRTLESIYVWHCKTWMLFARSPNFN